MQYTLSVHNTFNSGLSTSTWDSLEETRRGLGAFPYNLPLPAVEELLSTGYTEEHGGVLEFVLTGPGIVNTPAFGTVRWFFELEPRAQDGLSPAGLPEPPCCTDLEDARRHARELLDLPGCVSVVITGAQKVFTPAGWGFHAGGEVCHEMLT